VYPVGRTTHWYSQCRKVQVAEGDIQVQLPLLERTRENKFHPLTRSHILRLGAEGTRERRGSPSPHHSLMDCGCQWVDDEAGSGINEGNSGTVPRPRK